MNQSGATLQPAHYSLSKEIQKISEKIPIFEKWFSTSLKLKRVRFPSGALSNYKVEFKFNQKYSILINITLGEIELRSEKETDGFNSKYFGDIHFQQNGDPVLIIGHHTMSGKVVKVNNPWVTVQRQTLGSRVTKVVIFSTLDSDSDAHRNRRNKRLKT